MRKFLLLLLASLFTCMVSAQFNVGSGTRTEKEITIQGKNYPVLVTDKGSEYIVCISPSTKNEYPVWIGTRTEETYEGQAVRLTSTGKRFIFVVSPKTRNPYCKYLKDKATELVSNSKQKPKLT